MEGWREVHKIVGLLAWAHASPLGPAPDELWSRSSPFLKEGRSILIGVECERTAPPPVLKSRRNRNQIAPRAQRTAPISVTVLALERDSAIILWSG
jgi:hypothetical protein